LKALIPEIEDFIEFCLKKTSRSPQDLVSYQHLLWVAESPNSEKTGIELASVIHSLWMSYHRRLWNNSYDTLLSRLGFRSVHGVNIVTSSGGHCEIILCILEGHRLRNESV
jgi:hypothetical protein